MLTPSHHRRRRGDAPAVVMSRSGRTITYAELDDRSMQLARRFHAHGLRPGSRVAVLLENHPCYFEVLLAGIRSGLFVAPMNHHLDPVETAEMVKDSGAAALVTSATQADLVRSLGARRLADVTLRLAMDGPLDGFECYEEAVCSQPAEPIAGALEGAPMFYSGGTTGRPKAILPPMPASAFGERPNALAALVQAQWGFGPDTVLLTCAPLYHSGPTGFGQAVHRLGGTVVVLEDFDAEAVLRAIEEHEVTHALFVPTHFSRLLELDGSTRDRYDLSSLRFAIHGAGPCAIGVKEQMIDWWGKILHEYYVGSEGTSFTLVSSDDWLDRKGTVGKPLSGAVHVVDGTGAELPPGTTGRIWFETGSRFEYHNDPVATAAAFDERGWWTLGDAGHLDDDGWLYVTDRCADIVELGDGRVVSPQQIELGLLDAPGITDAAVVVRDGVVTAHVVTRCCISDVAHHEVDRVVAVESLPRLPTGKLLKRHL